MQLSDPAALSRADSVASMSGSGSVLHSRQPSIDQSADTVQPRHSAARLGPSQLARHSLAAFQALNPGPAAAPPAPASESAAVPAHGAGVVDAPSPASEAPRRQPEAAVSKAGDGEVAGNKAGGAELLPVASRGDLPGHAEVVPASGSHQQLSQQAVQPVVASGTETSGKPPRPPDPPVQVAQQASSPEKAATASAAAAGRPVLPGADGPGTYAPQSCCRLSPDPAPHAPQYWHAACLQTLTSPHLTHSTAAQTQGRRLRSLLSPHWRSQSRPQAPQLGPEVPRTARRHLQLLPQLPGTLGLLGCL